MSTARRATASVQRMIQEIKKVRVTTCQCGSPRSGEVALGTDREFFTSPDCFTVVECLECGLLYLNPRPDVTELDHIYPSTYQCYNIRKDPTEDQRTAITRLRHWLYSRRYRSPLRYLERQASIDLLDVGCGDGWQLDLYSIAGNGRIRTSGVEIKEDVCAAARARGHVIYCGQFENVDLPQQYDLVSLSQVIEHVANPTEFVQRIWDVLRPGGIFVLETPNTNTLDWAWFRTGAWGAYHIPRHWWFFNPTSIRSLGERAGFRMLEMKFNPAPVHWVWTLHNLSQARRDVLGTIGRRVFSPMDVFGGGVKALALLAAFTAVDIGLLMTTGRSSNMMVIFQKPGA
jgi:SAM-dependent methyltransferase